MKQRYLIKYFRSRIGYKSITMPFNNRRHINLCPYVEDVRNSNVKAINKEGVILYIDKKIMFVPLEDVYPNYMQKVIDNFIF